MSNIAWDQCRKFELTLTLVKFNLKLDKDKMNGVWPSLSERDDRGCIFIGSEEYILLY